MGMHTGPTSNWVEAGLSRLKIVLWGHTGSTSHWVEAGGSRLTIALWGCTLDQHQTGLRQVEVG